MNDQVILVRGVMWIKTEARKEYMVPKESKEAMMVQHEDKRKGIRDKQQCNTIE